MRVGIDSPLSSNLAFSTDLKRIQIPHSLFWVFRANKPLDILPEQSLNDNPARKKRLQVARDYKSYTILSRLPSWCLSGWGEILWLGLLGFYSDDSCRMLKVSASLSTNLWARQCTDMRAFILLHSLYFFSLGFRQWWSHVDRVLTLNMNIWLPLFRDCCGAI